MTVFLTVINVIVAIAAILLILLVVAQSNRGSDLGLFGGSAEMVFGSQQLNALAKITVILAIIVMGGVFLSGAIKVFTSKNNGTLSETSKQGSVLSDIKTKNTSNTTTVTPSPIASPTPIVESKTKANLKKEEKK